MSIIASLQRSLVRIHPAGYPFIATGLLVTVAASLVSAPLAWIGLGFTAWILYFFRDPRRTIPRSPDIVLSPADGLISMVAEVVPPPELELPPTPLLRISVFMSIFDCHVNRAPLAGRLARIAYTPGRFFNADLDKASEYNERNGLVLETAHGPIAVVQIAGLIARRIVHWVAEGDRLAAGERFGLIRFGSRLDVYLPQTAVILVAVGQTAVAGETVLANLSGAASPRTFHTN